MKLMKRVRYLLGSAVTLFILFIMAAPHTAAEKKQLRMRAPINDLPDLSVKQIWLDKKCAVSFTLVNDGKGALSAKDYRSGAVTISYEKNRKSFPLTQVDPGKKLLDPGGLATFFSNLNLSEDQKVQVVADPQNHILESDTTNNSRTILLKPNCSSGIVTSKKEIRTQPDAAKKSLSISKTSPVIAEPEDLPDLEITRISLNNDCKIAVALKNNGRGKLSPSRYNGAKIVIIYNRKKTSFSLARVDPGRKLVHPGNSIRFTTPLRLEKSQSVQAIVDPQDSVKESNEKNNAGRPVLLKPDCAPVKAKNLKSAPLKISKQSLPAATAFSIHSQNSPAGSQPPPAPGPGPEPPLPGSVTVTHPSASQYLREGENYLIRWEYQGLPATACVSLSLFQGSIQRELITQSTCGTSYNWNVPAYQYMTNYKIRAMVTGQPPGNAIFDDSAQFQMLQQDPDLFASNIHTTPSEPTTMGTTTVKATISNVGGQAPNTNSATLEIQGPNGYNRSFTYSFLPLEPQTPSSSYRVEEPLQGLPPGSYLAGLRVFSKKWGSPETIEKYWSHQFTVTGNPDLVTCLHDWNVKTTVNRSIPIYVKNVGTAPSAQTTFAFYLEKVGHFNYPVPPLSPGQDYQIPFPSRKYWLIGKVDMKGTVDPNNNVTELEENNNKRCATLTKYTFQPYNSTAFPECSDVLPCSAITPVTGGN